MKHAVLIAIMLALAGCDQYPTVTEQEPSVAEKSRSGIVLETIDAGTYTYIRINENGNELWLASSLVWLEEGQTIRFSDENLMKDFESKALGRTIPFIYFVKDVEVMLASPADSQVVVDPGPGAGDANAFVHPELSDMPMTVNVDRLEGGMTIAEIFAAHGELDGTELALRAKVIKFSANIMGTNWATVQDGTGSPPDNQLVLTTSQTVSVGDEIVARGIAKTDVDLGAGYFYKILLENAKITP